MVITAVVLFLLLFNAAKHFKYYHNIRSNILKDTRDLEKLNRATDKYAQTLKEFANKASEEKVEKLSDTGIEGMIKSNLRKSLIGEEYDPITPQLFIPLVEREMKYEKIRKRKEKAAKATNKEKEVIDEMKVLDPVKTLSNRMENAGNANGVQQNSSNVQQNSNSNDDSYNDVA